MKPSEILQANLLRSIAAKQALLADAAQCLSFEQAALDVARQYRNGGRLYIAGNGGSAADAQHLAAEFVSKLARDRKPLPAEALTVDTSILTAIGNDYGYDEVFSRQVEGKMSPQDIFLGITTSGNSKNIIRALEACKRMDIPSVVFAGRDGGLSKELATHCIVSPGEYTATIQEVHIVLAHTLCEYIEQLMFN
ncbi:SIS domain-containing protein [Paludibacterium sp. THUN1379]|uniref:D-sedoheptulose-7-phosphate isomerase n=1 Tax=Paludibacterium sp. THUN1379 TaxID=3112107 RepID=UPI0030CEE408